MICGFTLHPGEPCTKTMDKEVHLTMAALDGDIGINDVTKKKCCQVLVVTESSEFLLLCTLVEGFIYQQNVDLQLMAGERVTFCAKGGRVHLTGYSQGLQKEDVNRNSEKRTDGQDPEISTERIDPEPLTVLETQCESDVIEELFSEQDCRTSPSEISEDKDTVQCDKDVPQKEVETSTEKTTRSLEEHSCIVIKGEPLNCSTIVPEPEITVSRVEASPKQSEASKILGDIQELGPTTRDEGTTGHVTSRASSPVECINQALSITFVPSEVEDETVSQSVKETEIAQILPSESSNRGADKRQHHKERPMALAQTRADNISPLTQTTGLGSQRRNSSPPLTGILKETQGTSLCQGIDSLLSKPAVRPNVPKVAECYQYEVRNMIAPSEIKQANKAPTIHLLGPGNKPQGEKHPEVKRGTSSSAVAVNSHSERKRPHPSGENKARQNPSVSSLSPMDTNIQMKKSRLSDSNKPAEAAAVASQSTSTSGDGIQKNNIQSQTLFGRSEPSERRLMQVSLKKLPIVTAPATKKSKFVKRYKCDWCTKLSEERREIMLGEDKHLFCQNCHTMFSSDVQLLKYVRIVHQEKDK